LIREIIRIDEGLCNGCGECVPGCPEGALKIIDGKARLVGDLLCDGLGACIGNCPTGALTVERREAEPYDEAKVMKSMIALGVNTVIAHLEHLKNHGEIDHIQIALSVVDEQEFDGKAEIVRRWNEMNENAADQSPGSPSVDAHVHVHGSAGCPGIAARSFGSEARETVAVQAIAGAPAASALSHWPIQMHLMNPDSPHFAGSDFVLAADCTAFSVGAFHPDMLKGKTLGIACPKLDQGQESYVEKLRALIDDAKINTLTVVIMEVPCCGGLLQVAEAAAAQASRKVPIKQIVVGIQGQIVDQGWI